MIFAAHFTAALIRNAQKAIFVYRISTDVRISPCLFVWCVVWIDNFVKLKKSLLKQSQINSYAQIPVHWKPIIKAISVMDTNRTNIKQNLTLNLISVIDRLRCYCFFLGFSDSFSNCCYFLFLFFFLRVRFPDLHKKVVCLFWSWQWRLPVPQQAQLSIGNRRLMANYAIFKVSVITEMRKKSAGIWAWLQPVNR